jgi:hypothetical protein
MSARLSTALPSLFGAHVGGRADDAAEAARRRGQRWRVQRFRGVFAESLREAEVQHLDAIIGGELDVRRFEVAVNDPLVVCGFERVHELSREAERVGQRHGTARDAFVERRALDQLEDERCG